MESSQDAGQAASSAFAGGRYREVIDSLTEEICDLYKSDDIPWIVGYSGGKDSTATLQLVWNAIAKLPAVDRKKEVHVISTDTLVENPIVASWVTKSLNTMSAAATSADMPILTHRPAPNVGKSYWPRLSRTSA